MSDHRESDRDAVRLSEDAAHRVLARAIEPERDRGAETTIAELREVAREAGISMHAFDSALREGAALVARAEAGHRPAKSEHDGVMTGDETIKYNAPRPIRKIGVGDRIEVSPAAFETVAEAFFGERDARFS